MPGWYATVYCSALRASEVLVSFLPELLLGALLAGAIRGLLRPEQIMSVFGRPGLLGRLRATVAVSLFPLGSIGIQPVAHELRNKGVPAANLWVVVLANRLLNPLTLAWWATQLSAADLAILIAFSLLANIALGVVAARLPTIDPIPAVPAVPNAPLRRIANCLVSVSRVAGGRLVPYAIVAATISGAWAMQFEPDTIAHGAQEPGDLWAGIGTAWFTGPSCVPILWGGMLVQQFRRTGATWGATLALATFGVGLNVPLVLWIGRWFGVARLTAMALLLAALTFGGGLLLDLAVSPTSDEPHHESHDAHVEPCKGRDGENHSHATDTLARPWFPDQIYGEIRVVRADGVVAVHQGHADEALRNLRAYLAFVRKLPMSLWLRHGRVESDDRESIDSLARVLEQIIAFVEQDKMDEARQLVRPLFQADTRCFDRFGRPEGENHGQYKHEPQASGSPLPDAPNHLFASRAGIGWLCTIAERTTERLALN
jgi:uncharacterized membrane protein YraQ (UPF0718 family)